jgi:hypothetical protein
MANITAAECAELFTSIQSYAEQLNIFQATKTNDPRNAPGSRLFCSITLGAVRPVLSSGLAAVSLQVTLIVRVWSSELQQPYESIDPEVLAATCSLMGKFAGGLTLGGAVREIDLMAMSAQPAYVDFDGKPYRVSEISVPLIVNDTFAEVA